VGRPPPILFGPVHDSKSEVTLVIDLEPEVEASLNRLAEARGVTPAAYLQVLVSELACSENSRRDFGWSARMQRALSALRHSHSHRDLAAANELLAVFRAEERKTNKILPRAQSGAIDAVQQAGGAHLSATEMEKRIVALGTPEEWTKRYESWIRSHLDVTNPPGKPPVSFTAPEYSAKELSELELELMCDDLAGRSTDSEELSS
jgi:hypothetical protein